MYLSPAQTDVSYDGGTGTNATVGALKLSNVSIVAASKGATGAMQGMVTNNSDAAVMFTVVVGASTSRVTVPADTALRLDGKPSGNSTRTIAPVRVAATPSAPGTKVTATFNLQDVGQSPVLIPILLPGQAVNS